MVIMAGGFGLCGVTETLVEAIKESGVKGLTVISNNAGVDGIHLGKLLETRQIRKMISSYVGENKIFAQQYLAVNSNSNSTPRARWQSAFARVARAFPPSTPPPAMAR